MSRVQGSYKNLPANFNNIPIAVPACARFNSMPASVGGTLRDKYVSSTVSTSVTSGGLIRFEIPPSASEMLMPHKTYMRFQLRTKATAKADAALLLSSASDVIRRLDVRIGGQQIDNISRYNKLYGALKVSNCPSNYRTTDGSISEKMNITMPVGADAGLYQVAAVDCYIPLLSGLFTSDRCIPLNLLTSPIVVTIELDTAGNLASLADHAGFEFEVSNARLYFQTVDMGEMYNSALKQELGAQGLMRMSYVTFSGSEYTNAATVNILLGENCSSLLGVIVGVQGAAGKLNTLSQENYIKDGYVSGEFKIDGLQHPTYLIDSPHQAWVEAQKLFSGVFNTDHTGSYGAVNTTFPDGRFVHGISTTRFHENTLSLVGSPVANHIQITKLSTGAVGSTFYVWTVKENQLIIDASGTVSVAK
jgi:hypothetical protein